MPGVLAVLTGADAKAEGLGGIGYIAFQLTRRGQSILAIPTNTRG
jgi:hypothetical protein